MPWAGSKSFPQVSAIKDFALFRSPAGKQFRFACGSLKPLEIEQINDEVWVVQPYNGSGFFELPIVEEPKAKAKLLSTKVEMIAEGTNGKQGDASEDGQAKREKYVQAVEAAVQAIRGGEMQKVVLARTKLGILDKNLTVGLLAEQLAARYPNAYLTISYSAQFGFWVGASPELLLKTTDFQHFESLSIAGTRAATAQGSWGMKEQAEQSIVTDYIAHQLRALGGYAIEIEAGASTAFGPIAHLSNKVRWQMLLESKEELLSVLAKLHPTPAVVGLPRLAAASFIAKHEGFDRGLYVGLWGTMGPSSTELYVNLRCAELRGQTIKAYAGAGIIENSVAEDEWSETEDKANAILNAFARWYDLT